MVLGRLDVKIFFIGHLEEHLMKFKRVKIFMGVILARVVVELLSVHSMLMQITSGWQQ